MFKFLETCGAFTYGDGSGANVCIKAAGHNGRHSYVIVSTDPTDKTQRVSIQNVRERGAMHMLHDASISCEDVTTWYIPS